MSPQIAKSTVGVGPSRLRRTLQPRCVHRGLNGMVGDRMFAEDREVVFGPVSKRFGGCNQNSAFPHRSTFAPAPSIGKS